MHLAHIVNTFNAPTASDLHLAQKITLESMKLARQNAEQHIHIQQYAVCYEEDLNTVPEEFEHLIISDSVLNYCENGDSSKKLPLIGEIFNVVFENTAPDYFIYTNIDIGLYPNFYNDVANIIALGHDAAIINRRRLPKHLKNLDEIYKTTGKVHPGFDCFIIPKYMVPKLELSKICIGVPFIGITIAQNIFALSQNYKLVQDAISTFHIGEKIYMRRNKSFYPHNRIHFWKAMKKLKKAHGFSKLPFSDKNILTRMITYGLHPSIPVRWVLILAYRDLLRSLKSLKKIK